MEFIQKFMNGILPKYTEVDTFNHTCMYKTTLPHYSDLFPDEILISIIYYPETDKYIVSVDITNGFYQKHLGAEADNKYLAIMELSVMFKELDIVSRIKLNQKGV